jgi:hypothetical protein
LFGGKRSQCRLVMVQYMYIYSRAAALDSRAHVEGRVSAQLVVAGTVSRHMQNRVREYLEEPVHITYYI